VSTRDKQASTSSGSRQDLSIGVPRERILLAIHVIRGQKVLLDADLAELYGVETKVLTRAYRRNQERFPEDFAFQLSPAEFDILRRQSGTSSSWGGRRYAPYAFTEQGVAMLSSVLRSKRAVDVNIEIMRAFVHLRRLLATHEDLADKLNELEKRYDRQFRVVFDAIRQLMAPTPAENRRSASPPKKRSSDPTGSAFRTNLDLPLATNYQLPAIVSPRTPVPSPTRTMNPGLCPSARVSCPCPRKGVVFDRMGVLED